MLRIWGQRVARRHVFLLFIIRLFKIYSATLSLKYPVDRAKYILKFNE